MKDEEIEKLIGEIADARVVAMDRTVRARIPECGDFGGIAQTLDAALPIIRQLRDEVKALREDAARYRWLCRNAAEAWYGDEALDYLSDPMSMDRAIDAALSQEARK